MMTEFLGQNLPLACAALPLLLMIIHFCW